MRFNTVFERVQTTPISAGAKSGEAPSAQVVLHTRPDVGLQAAKREMRVWDSRAFAGVCFSGGGDMCGW